MRSNAKWRYAPNKKKRHRKEKQTDSQNPNKEKGSLLEQIVAAMYDTPGVTIERNVRHPTSSNRKDRRREIDIVLTANVAGLPVKYAFQCKNESKAIGVGKIDAFIGALDDVGVPPRYGVFISVNGFTKDAIERAKKAGIRTLVLKGLTKDRLKSELSSAIQHNIFLIPRIDEISIDNDFDEQEYEMQFFLFQDENKKVYGLLSDLVFNKWRNNEIPDQIGPHEVNVQIPLGWFQYYKGKKIQSRNIIAKVTVLAVVISLDGKAANYLLFDAATKQFEKLDTRVRFTQLKQGEVVPLEVFSTEKALNDFVSKSENITVTTRAKLDRIITNFMYYPLSEPVAQDIFARMRNLKDKIEKIDQEAIQEEIFEINRNDLLSEGIYNLVGKEMSVIITDNDGETVDVHLLFEKGEYDKIISLKDRYLRNPIKSFGKLLVGAYVEKAQVVLIKAKNEIVNERDRLLAQGVEMVEEALVIDPNSTPAIEQLASFYFHQNKLTEAFQLVERLTKNSPDDWQHWSNKVLVLMSMKNWEAALDATNQAIELAKRHKIKNDLLAFELLRRANVYYRLEKYPEAWKDLLEGWNTNPERIIQEMQSTRIAEKIIMENETLEGILLFIEILYARAAKFEKRGQSDIASEIANYASEQLCRLMPLNKIKGEPELTGQLDGNLLEGVLERSCKRLFDTGSVSFANPHLEKIKEWYCNTLGGDMTFFEFLQVTKRAA